MPGADQREPGGPYDAMTYGQVLPGRTLPLVDVISGAVLLIAAAGLAVFVFGFVPHLNLPAVLLAGFGILAFLGVGIFALIRGGRRGVAQVAHCGCRQSLSSAVGALPAERLDALEQFGTLDSASPSPSASALSGR